MRRASRFLLLALLLGMVGCDHATKVGAKAALEGKAPLDLVRGVLDLRYAENRDTAFSLTNGLHWAGKETLLAALASAALVGIGAMWWRRRRAPLAEQAGFALCIAGAVGNIADRIARGYVVDFIHLAHWPVFNVADAAVCVGAGLLVLTHWRRTPSAVR
ncbi:MAG TPA: signal peptidase II [Polyangiaceae bacterium]|jgi:signal peptidase II